MANFIIIGDGHIAIQRSAVFRDIVDGKVPNAFYMHYRLFCMSNNRLHRFLVGKKFERLLERLPFLKPLGTPIIEAATKRMRPNFDRLRTHLSETEENYVILSPICKNEWLHPDLIEKFRAEPLCHHLLIYLIDSIESLSEYQKMSVDELLALFDLADATYTYSPEDARLHPEHLQFIDLPVWHASLPAQAQPTQDLYFCGANKKRLDLLISIKERLTNAGLTSELVIVRGPDAPCVERGVLMTNVYIPYEENLVKTQRANCILEIIAEGSNAPTLRYKEAVIYNKKLLTNNPGIVNLPYYDPRWMRTFQTADDIDLEWLHAVEPIDYGYQGDFHAKDFLKRVEEATKKDEA